LSELSNVIYSLGVNTTYVNINATPRNNAICAFQLDVRDLKQLNMIIAELNKLKSVLHVKRIKGSFRGTEKNKSRKNIDIRH